MKGVRNAAGGAVTAAELGRTADGATGVRGGRVLAPERLRSLRLRESISLRFPGRTRIVTTRDTRDFFSMTTRDGRATFRRTARELPLVCSADLLSVSSLPDAASVERPRRRLRRAIVASSGSADEVFLFRSRRGSSEASAWAAGSLRLGSASAPSCM